MLNERYENKDHTGRCNRRISEGEGIIGMVIVSDRMMEGSGHI